MANTTKFAGYRVLASFGGEVLADKLTSYDDALRIASEHSANYPTDVWTTIGGAFGAGVRTDHFNEGIREKLV
jgi:hypothetical protein